METAQQISRISQDQLPPKIGDFHQARARRLSWQEVAVVFHTTWETVYRSVEYAVAWGLARRTMTGIKAIAVDEVQWQRGHHYLTLVYQIDAGFRRLLWVGLDRTAESLRGFFQTTTDEIKNSIRYLCSDMWKPYLNVLAQEVSGAVHVLDRFHIMQAMNKAIDEVRAEEARRLKRDGYEPVLKRARWRLLKRPENLTRKQTAKTGRAGAVQPEIRQKLFAARGFLAFLDVQVSRLGESVSAQMVDQDDAIKDRADEESCSDASQP